MRAVLHIAGAFLAAASAVRGLSYALPAGFPVSILASSDCKMPQNFNVSQLVVWEPATANPNQNDTADFVFTDSDTGIVTPCHKNASSINVAWPGDAPRYACDNPLVLFIWQSGKLLMIEQACPETSGSTKYEASGSLSPGFQCEPTDPTLPMGEGFLCVSVDQNMAGKFTSLQPAPPPPAPPSGSSTS
ncbi:hypothetical protein QBC47DRAFT_205130 [Echria macrotheca]|uniref:AA1-like domain-containing protein n=1 Tax=Echria macrotheca TaxID=438768 RepID=A0AAJ0BBV6_9PEZI|nr:hypothetical protein QBC47DRAFT_205130 [Echria macrotheca]